MLTGELILAWPDDCLQVGAVLIIAGAVALARCVQARRARRFQRLQEISLASMSRGGGSAAIYTPSSEA